MRMWSSKLTNLRGVIHVFEGCNSQVQLGLSLPQRKRTNRALIQKCYVVEMRFKFLKFGMEIKKVPFLTFVFALGLIIRQPRRQSDVSIFEEMLCGFRSTVYL